MNKSALSIISRLLNDRTYKRASGDLTMVARRETIQLYHAQQYAPNTPLFKTVKA